MDNILSRYVKKKNSNKKTNEKQSCINIDLNIWRRKKGGLLSELDRPLDTFGGGDSNIVQLYLHPNNNISSNRKA